MVNTFDATLRTFNPWIRHADSNTEGYALVTLTPDKLSCTFHTLKLLDGGTAPAQPATASTKVLEVAAGTADVSVL
ncbi:hypothetical protein D3C72_2411460 [compost metagenome]